MRKITMLVEQLPANFMMNVMEEKKVTVTGIVEEFVVINKGEKLNELDCSQKPERVSKWVEDRIRPKTC